MNKMEVFEIKRTGLQRQPSTGPTPGGKKVPYLVAVVALVLVTSVSLVILHIFLGYKNLKEGAILLQRKTLHSYECSRTVCNSKDCISMASRMLQLLNPEADPCSDFYEYSCGGYAKYKGVPYGRNSYTPETETQLKILLNIRKLMESPSNTSESHTTRKLKKFYRTCMNSEQRNQQQKQSLDNWFSDIELSLNDVHSQYVMDLTSQGSWRVLASRLEEYQIHTIVKPSFKGSKTVPIEKIYVDCTVPFFQPRVYSDSNSSDYAYVLSLYKDVIDKTLQLLPLDEVKRTKFVEDVLQMETDIATAIEDSEVLDGLTILMEQGSVVLLKDMWRTMIGEAIQEADVVSTCKYNLETILSVLNNARPEMAANYVVWRMLSQVIQYLGSDFQNLNLHYMSKLPRWNNAFGSKWQECADVIRREFGVAAFKALLDFDYIPVELIHEIKKAFLEAKRNFLLSFQSILWAKGIIRKNFIKKIENMRLDLGFPDLIIEQNVMDTLYQDLEFEDNFFLDVMNLKKFKARHSITRLWYGNSENLANNISLEKNPLGDSASYDYISNTVRVDIGLLLPPAFLYLGNIPRYLKFSEYSLLVREMSHAFDASGSFYDGNGKKWEKIWWPQIMEEKHDFYIQCLQNQTALLRNSSEGYSLELLNSVVADIGSFLVLYSGLSAHLETWKNEKELPGINLTKRQIYYVRVAQSSCELHEPSHESEVEYFQSSRFKVNIAVSNMEDFGNVFSCPANSILNPYVKCNLQ